jgi:hypothetical protein
MISGKQKKGVGGGEGNSCLSTHCSRQHLFATTLRLRILVLCGEGMAGGLVWDGLGWNGEVLQIK